MGYSTDVPIQKGRAGRTGPFPIIQRQRIVDVSATGTAFGTGEERVDCDNTSPGPIRLVFQHSYEMSPACIGNVLAKLGVADHVLDLQRFDADHFVIVNQSAG